MDMAKSFEGMEYRLATDPQFGDSRILARAYDYALKCLEHMAASGCMEAGVLVRRIGEDTTARVAPCLFGDPAVRHAIAEGVLANDGNGAWRDVLADAIRFLDSGADGLPVLPTGARITPWATVWHRNGKEYAAADARFAAIFARHIASLAASPAATLAAEPPEAAVLDTLREGVTLLQSACPHLYRSILSVPYVRVVGLLAAPDPSNVCRSITAHPVAGAVFLGPDSLRSPLRAADSLLHEHLHRVLSEIVLTGQVYRPGYTNDDDAPGPRITAVWNGDGSEWNSPRWTVDRSLGALHVYTHLCAFHGRLCSHGNSEYGPAARCASHAALDRASYLASEFQRREEVRRELDEDGLRLVGWLAESLSEVPFTPGDPRRYPEQQT